MKHVVIVGAGVSGLGTAYHVQRLARERGIELDITVLERGSRPGGRVWTETVQGFHIEVGANGFLDSKQSTLDLCDELGLSSELIAARPESKNRYLFWRDVLHKLPTGPGELLRSGLLSFRGKLRLLSEPFVRARRDGADESVHQFACRRVGREAADVLIDALVTGIHAGDPELLSAPAAFPRMVELERQYGSLVRAMFKLRRKRIAEHHSVLSAQYSVPSTQHSVTRTQRSSSPAGTLWSLRGGMGQLMQRLVDAASVDLNSGVHVKQILPVDAGGWLVCGEGRDRWPADAIVLACPSFAQAEIVHSFDPVLADELAGIRYNSIAVVALGFRAADLSRPLDGFGYLSPQRSRRDVLGVLWNSSIFEQRAPDGMVLVQAMCGGTNRPDIVGWDDERLVRAVLTELRQTLDITAAPSLVRIIRWPQAIPQYHVGHIARVTAIESRRQRHAGLFLTGNSFRGVSVNDCTEDSLRCAEVVVHDLTGRTGG